MNLINKILLVLKEEDNLFRPRNIDNRLKERRKEIEKEKDPILKEILLDLLETNKVKVYCPFLDKVLVGKINSDVFIGFSDSEAKISFSTAKYKAWAELVIKKSDVKIGDKYGTYTGLIIFSKEYNTWIKYGNFNDDYWNEFKIRHE